MTELDSRRTFAKNLQGLMDENGKTRQDLCDDLGIKYTTLTGWLTGATYPRIDKIETLANYFHVYMADLTEPKGGGYYINQQASDIADFLRQHPEHAVLFDAAKKVKPEDIEKVIAMMGIIDR